MKKVVVVVVVVLFLTKNLFQHVVVEVELGEKEIQRSKSSQTEFTKYAMSNISSFNEAKHFLLMKEFQL